METQGLFLRIDKVIADKLDRLVNARFGKTKAEVVRSLIEQEADRLESKSTNGNGKSGENHG